MGFFSSVKKLVKQMHSPQAIMNSVVGAASGAIMGIGGGPAGVIAGAAVGAVSGGLQGTMQTRQEEKQEKAQQAQMAAAQRIADAQNPANLATAVTPNAIMENAQVSEENMANEARRRYSFSKTLYKNRSRLGNSGSAGNSATRITLG